MSIHSIGKAKSFLGKISIKIYGTLHNGDTRCSKCYTRRVAMSAKGV